MSVASTGSTATISQTRCAPDSIPSSKCNSTVVATTAEHAERLLKSTKPQLGGVLNKDDRPLAAAVAIDFSGALKAAMPWIELGLAKANQGADNMAVTDQVLTLVEVLTVVRSFTSEIYYEDDALVSHMLLEIGDLKE